MQGATNVSGTYASSEASAYSLGQVAALASDNAGACQVQAPTQTPSYEYLRVKNKKRRRAGKAFSLALDLLIGVLVIGVLLSFTSGGDEDAMPHVIGGYAASCILTESMQDVYPKDTLIITKHTDPSELRVGDDITFMVSSDTSCTHRIIEVVPDAYQSGQVGFKTQGVSNTLPDESMVLASNVIGKVIFANHALGVVITFMKKNLPLLIFLVILACVTCALLKRVLKQDGKRKPLGAFDGLQVVGNTPQSSNASVTSSMPRGSSVLASMPSTQKVMSEPLAQASYPPSYVKGVMLGDARI